jgi:hypothetical protein
MIEDEKNMKSHYVLIKNMSRLLGDRNNHDGAHHYCDYCLHGFQKDEQLQNHVEDCKKFGIQKVVLPDEDNR